MTVIVRNGSLSVLSGLGKMKAAMIEDYAKFMPPSKSDTTAKMNAAYAENFTITYGRSISRLPKRVVVLRRLSLVLTMTRSSRRVTF